MPRATQEDTARATNKSPVAYPNDSFSSASSLLSTPACERSVSAVFQLLSPDAITVKMKGKREGGRHILLFVFARGPRAADARWVTTAEAS
jgi:hypothetical protein